MEVSTAKTGRRGLTIGLALLALVLFAAGWYAARSVLQNGGPAASVASSPAGANGGSALASMMQLVIKQTRLWKGDASAPVTIVEFADFQ
jgi:hypothetical protein